MASPYLLPMKRGITAAWISFGAAAGFGAGWLSVSKSSPPEAFSVTGARISSSLPAEASRDGEGENKQARRERREPAASAKPDFVSIPLKTLVGINRKRGLASSASFESNDEQVKTMLGLLGASEAQTGEVQNLFHDQKTKLLAAEKTRIKTVKADQASIVLDLSDMEGPSQEAIAELKSAIRDKLPGDIAGAFIEGYPWDNYYSYTRSSDADGSVREGPDTRTFTIERQRGALWMELQYFGAGQGYMISSGDHPDDGTPIDAAKAHPSDRWAPFLSGHQLLPTDAP